MVWSFLSQVLRDGKEASCQSAVARVVSYCQQAEIVDSVISGNQGNTKIVLFALAV